MTLVQTFSCSHNIQIGRHDLNSAKLSLALAITKNSPFTKMYLIVATRITRFSFGQQTDVTDNVAGDSSEGRATAGNHLQLHQGA